MPTPWARGGDVGWEELTDISPGHGGDAREGAGVTGDGGPLAQRHRGEGAGPARDARDPGHCWHGRSRKAAPGCTSSCQRERRAVWGMFRIPPSPRPPALRVGCPLTLDPLVRLVERSLIRGPPFSGCLAHSLTFFSCLHLTSDKGSGVLDREL